MTKYCFNCGAKLQNFGVVIIGVLQANSISLPDDTPFLSRSGRCGIETELIISEIILTEIQKQLTLVHDALPDPKPEPEPEPIEEKHITTLEDVMSKLQELETKIDTLKPL